MSEAGPSRGCVGPGPAVLSADRSSGPAGDKGSLSQWRSGRRGPAGRSGAGRERMMSPVAVKVPERGGAPGGEGRERWSLGGEREGGDLKS